MKLHKVGLGSLAVVAVLLAVTGCGTGGPSSTLPGVADNSSQNSSNAPTTASTVATNQSTAGSETSNSANTVNSTPNSTTGSSPTNTTATNKPAGTSEDSGKAAETSSQQTRPTKQSVIKTVQERLNHLGYAVGTADGIFGVATLREIEKFQSENHLTVNGTVGLSTWKALFKNTAQANAYPGYSLSPSADVREAEQEPEQEDTPSSSTTASTAGAKDSTQAPLWLRPTGGAYPDLRKYKNVWVDVSISKQRTYIKSGNTTIYTMIVSTGLKGPNTQTPIGTFHIQKERGTWFYAPRFEEGAEYWVSFLNHGEFLFHSVPFTENHRVIVWNAKLLGQEASHGCVHLSIPDAKWFYDSIPFGTKVVIHQ